MLGSCDSGVSVSDIDLDPVVHVRKANATSFSIDGGVDATYSQSVNLISFDAVNTDQQWVEIDRGDGYYSYQKRNTNFCLDGQDGGTNGQFVLLDACEEANQNQHWMKVGINTTFRLEKRNAPGFSIYGGAGGANAQAIRLWSSADNDEDQHWFVTRQLESRVSGSLVSNGTFEESNLKNWTQQEPAFESDVAFEGRKSAKLEDFGSVSQSLIISPNTQYEVSAMIEGDGSIGIVVGGQVIERRGQSEDYALVNFEFNSGSYDNAQLFARAASDTTRIDNVEVFAASDLSPIAPVPSPSADFDIEFSTSQVRSNLRDLSGATVSGQIYVVVGPAAEIDRVDFYIDNTSLSGSPSKTENHAPFDLQGTGTSGAVPFDTDDLSDGTHTISVRVLFNNRSTQTGSVAFNVDNNTGTPTPTGPTENFGLNPNDSPWENFNLENVWALDTPAPRSNDRCKAERTDEDEWDDISNASRQFIYTHTDGGMRFSTRIDGETTSDSCNSGFVRSELREMLRGGNTNVSTTGVNDNNWKLGYQPGNSNSWGGENGEMHATLRVNKVTTTGDSNQVGRVIIGQIHADNDEPLRLYYRKRVGQSNGCVYFAHEIRGDDDVDFNMIGNESCTSGPSNGIELNELFSYSIINDDEEIKVIIRRSDRDGPVIAQETIDMNELDSGYDRSDEWMYFKAGAYTQNNTGSGSDGDIVTFYRLSKSHD